MDQLIHPVCDDVASQPGLPADLGPGPGTVLAYQGQHGRQRAHLFGHGVGEQIRVHRGTFRVVGQLKHIKC
ncbi:MULTISPECIES: hypothetical protein [Tessaracoccus]|uniref:hypothetical protein n=1 Tax=Tessaracoccus TaxID=72763 RepID=UPI0018D91567|nr:MULTISPECIES: hypothetical protein [Tessaracoccus]